MSRRYRPGPVFSLADGKRTRIAVEPAHRRIRRKLDPDRVQTVVGLISGASMLTIAEQETEAEIVAVAAAQPHRRGSLDELDGSPLGRLVKAHWSDDDDRRRYLWAGLLYGQLIDNFQVASGLAARLWGKAAAVPSELTVEEAEERKELARLKLADAEDAIREVDNRTVGILRRLCYDDEEVRDRDVGRARNGLYKLGVHFGIIRNRR